MATKNKTTLGQLAAEVFGDGAFADAVEAGSSTPPAHRLYVFDKRCTNDHGHFVKGDKARGAFSAELVASYVAAGILVRRKGG